MTDILMIVAEPSIHPKDGARQRAEAGRDDPQARRSGHSNSRL